MDSRDIIRAIITAGWYKVGQEGSHVQFKPPDQAGRVTVPHPRKDVPIGTIKASNANRASNWGADKMATYIALLRKDPDSDFGVDFPDFPGCITAGSTIDEAFALAHEALAFHVAGMQEDGEPIPEPSPLEDVTADPGNAGAVPFLVNISAGRSRVVRVNITLPEELVREIDRVSKNRSRFLADAARRALRAA